jgi:putative ABC transport system permease protein
LRRADLQTKQDDKRGLLLAAPNRSRRSAATHAAHAGWKIYCRQKPGFTLVALLILSLGIGATTVMFAVINSVLLRPLPYPEPDRLVTLRGSIEQFGEFWGFSSLDFGDAKRESQTLALAAWTYSGGTISEPGEPQYVNGRQISAELFSTLGISPVQGRAFRPDEDRPGAAAVAIISYGL